MTDNPFTMLGLPVTARLSDDEVRAAWRRIAASTHPDREDGGDPARFGSAAAAYVLLRTSFGRGEALADLGAEPPGAGRRARHGHRARRGAHRARAGGPSPARGWNWHPGGRGRPGRQRRRGGNGWPRPAGRGLLLRVGCAAAVAAATVAEVGLTPATIGLLAGALTVAGWALWRQAGLGR